MDTDNKKTDDNNITGGEKDTLHNAGVDLSSSDVKEEGFVDIDKAPSANDPELKEMGLKFTPKENKEDLSLLKEQMDNKNKEQVIAPAPADSSVASTKSKPPVLESSKVEDVKGDNISDLEKEFNKTVGQAPLSTNNESLNEKISSLQLMLEKIKEKLGFKKKEVKEELDNLKAVKEEIAEDIENIKDLEDSRVKIEKELEKVETIKNEISSIEKEVKEELES